MHPDDQPPALELTTLLLEVADGVAFVTLDRPEVLNSFDPTMRRGAGGRCGRRCGPRPRCGPSCSPASGDQAFCTGIDRSSVDEFDFTRSVRRPRPPDRAQEPGALEAGHRRGQRHGLRRRLLHARRGRRHHRRRARDVLRPPRHLRDGGGVRTAPAAPADAVRRSPAHVARGHDERIAARPPSDRPGQRGRPARRAAGRGPHLARTIAAQPPLAVQATLRTLWAAKDLPGVQATDLGNVFLQLGTTAGAPSDGQEGFTAGKRPKPRIR